jgi:hypothetical protein
VNAKCDDIVTAAANRDYRPFLDNSNCTRHGSACIHSSFTLHLRVEEPHIHIPMKPRPTLPTFARTNLQCRRNVHIRAIAPTLSCQIWHDNTRTTVQTRAILTPYPKRCASTSTRPAAKSSYGRESPPTAKPTTKTSVPAKSKPSHNTTTVAKLSSAPDSAKPPALPILRAKENLNPPISTYAPELKVPVRGGEQGFISYIWKSGRSYLSFYKTSVGNVRSTSKLARSLREKAKGKDPSQVLTRAEWQIVARSRKDMLRLPAFGLIFLIFGEWTPLLVMYITPIIPEPCRIPRQVHSDLSKLEARRHARQRKASLDAMRLMARDRGIAGSGGHDVVASAHTIRTTNPLDLTLFELVLASARFNCHSKLWDWAMLTPPKFWLKRNLRKTYEYLRTDDRLIERDGGHQALEMREVQRACVERGMDVLGKKEGEMRRALEGWFAGKM